MPKIRSCSYRALSYMVREPVHSIIGIILEANIKVSQNLMKKGCHVPIQTTEMMETKLLRFRILSTSVAIFYILEKGFMGGTNGGFYVVS